MSDYVVVVLVVLIVCTDILALRHIMRSDADSGMKEVYALIVLLLPVIGLSIYYGTQNRGNR